MCVSTPSVADSFEDKQLPCHHLSPRVTVRSTQDLPIPYLPHPGTLLMPTWLKMALYHSWSSRELVWRNERKQGSSHPSEPAR